MVGYVISWAQSSQVIQSYGSALSAYGLIFLGAHFIWAFSLMFLFGRGYWQELLNQSFGLITN
jgi:photosystem I P700 chlorophyll a apoprotein A1